MPDHTLDLFGGAPDPSERAPKTPRKRRTLEKPALSASLDFAAKAAQVPEIRQEGEIAAQSRGPKVLSVSEVTRAVRSAIESKFDEVWVEGEISNYRQQASGHQYFTLKDAECQLACVRFSRPGLWRKDVPLRDGMLVQARGRLTVYEARGQYQLNVSAIQPAGAGLLQAQFEALKRKLALEGLFDEERKRELPRFPRALGIVTSPTGAALKDMLNILSRRAPWLRVIISPARVQGEGAAAEMTTALQDLEQMAASGAAPIDVIVVARGGGSMEDLWEFNHEDFARAIAACSIPVVSAVGHEIDFTISDFVADLRAPTPSAAAEIVAPDAAELHARLQQKAAYFHRCATARVLECSRHLAGLARSALFREPQQRIEQLAQRVDSAEQSLWREVKAQLAGYQQSLVHAAGELKQHRPDRVLALLRSRLEPLGAGLASTFERQIQKRRDRLGRVAEMLRLLSPDSTLQRGYTLTTDSEGRLLRSSQDVPARTVLVTSFHDGKVTSVVKSAENSPEQKPE